MLIQRLRLKKLLSFNDATVELGPLNVLIGPNAVGKSNLIEAISLLQAAPTGILTPILRGGGVRQWIWLGDPVASPIATLGCDLELGGVSGVSPGPGVTYEIEFSEDNRGFLILRERLAPASVPGEAGADYLERFYETARFGGAAANGHGDMKLPFTESIFSQYKNPTDPTPITEIGNQFRRIQIFREFRTGRNSGARTGVSTSVGKESLADGGDNLAMVLNELDFLGVHERIREYLGRFCDRFQDVKVSVGEGLVRTFLREAGLKDMLSSLRMSDGTLKFLSLLAALFHPNRPPVICIEEPEIGLHPDALGLVAEVLMDASQEVQLIVTTHSDVLVDFLSDRPEAVLVCERDFDNGTQMKRLSGDELKDWLKDYRLGELWRKGEIGGGHW